MMFEEVTFPEKGIYVAVKDGSTKYYISSVSFPGSTVKKLDEKFIPNTIARVDALASKAPLSHTIDTTVHITAAERTAWNAKSNLALGTTSSTAFRGDYGNTAYTHSQAAHAPSNAQKNSDITKAEIEAKLTGSITSHTHTSVNGYTVWVGTQSEYDAIASKSSTTLYFIK